MWQKFLNNNQNFLTGSIPLAFCKDIHSVKNMNISKYKEK